MVIWGGSGRLDDAVRNAGGTVHSDMGRISAVMDEHRRGSGEDNIKDIYILCTEKNCKQHGEPWKTTNTYKS